MPVPTLFPARWAAIGAIAGLLGACAAGPVPELPTPQTPGTPPIAGGDLPGSGAGEPTSGGEAPTGGTSVAGIVFIPSGNTDMDAWRSDFARRALDSGRSRSAVAAILNNISPMEIYLGSSLKPASTGISDQAEFAKPIWEYLRTAVSADRKQTGRDKIRANRALFDGLEARYGVDASVLAAIWGMETNFGGYIGTDDAANALSNMAVEGRRRSFAEKELTALMKLVEMGAVERSDLVSGWAGAMGQTQFMPTTFLAHAEDFTGDGKIDVWDSPADALASAANYLAVSGYRRGQPWGIEVRTPANFDFSLADGSEQRIETWVNKGLVPADGGGFDTGSATEAELWLPAGASGPKFLLFDNFDVFKTYNRADSYALAVGLLSLGVTGETAPLQAWPTTLEPLSTAEVKELQAALNKMGFDAGPVDGIAGRGTKRALQRFQKNRGFIADGFPTTVMLAYVLDAAGS